MPFYETPPFSRCGVSSRTNQLSLSAAAQPIGKRVILAARAVFPGLLQECKLFNMETAVDKLEAMVSSVGFFFYLIFQPDC